MPGVWVYAHIQPGGGLDASSLELLTRARSLAADVSAVALGPGATQAVDALGQHGARTVFVGDDPVYDDYIAQPAAYALAQLATEHRPELILFSPTFDARDVAGRLQAMLACTLMTNVDDLPAPDRARTRAPLRISPRQGRSAGAEGETAIVEVLLTGPTPRLVIPRAKVFEASPSGGQAAVIEIQLSIPDGLKRARRVERHEDERTGPALESARVVVSGGRGLENASNFALLHELAGLIGNAAVGASRPVVDDGWVPYSMQIGQTGKTVAPDVYIAVGISGASQHIVGMEHAKHVIAVNRDRHAAIFQSADLGIVGDALEIIPAVIDELKRSGVDS